MPQRAFNSNNSYSSEEFQESPNEMLSAFDRNILARSFDQCGITPSSLDDLHTQLGIFVSTSKFVDTVDQANETVETLSPKMRKPKVLTKYGQ